MITRREPAGISNARGPGVLESVAWTIGYLVVQLIVSVVLILVLILFAFDGWPAQIEFIEQAVFQLGESGQSWLSVYVSGGATLLSLFLIVPAVCWRLRPAPRRALGTDVPGGRQMVLLAGVVMPLAILSDELYRAASRAFDILRSQLAETWPVIEQLGQTDTIALVQSQAAHTAYPLLLVIVGVGPAIGEELVFRGVIGRGLTSRLGVFWGVLLTSLLFAVAHGTPAHAVATLPLGFFLHWTYLTTGTIWAPILLHFLNNALSVTMLKFSLGANVLVSWGMLTSASVYVIAVGFLLWQSRDRHELLHRPKSSWSLPRLNAEAAGSATCVVSPSLLKLWVTTGVLGFTWAFVTSTVAGG